MTTFPGVATLSEGDVPVVIGLDEDRITLQVGDVSVGEWLASDCDLVDLGSGAFLIETGGDSISIQPDDPGGFARNLGLWPRPIRSVGVPETGADYRFEVTEGPAPRKLTVMAFYALIAFTTVMMVWALLRIVM